MGEIHNFDVGVTDNIDALRKFHNWIKLQLIHKAKKMTNGKSLLDIAVGRGGDLYKWSGREANLEYVTGIDSDGDAIFGTKRTVGWDGARERVRQFNGKKPNVNLWKLSATDPDILTKLGEKDNNKVYDIVSCQFAFHYFVQHMDHVLSLISSKLKPGGVFIGTASDGDLIKTNLIKGNVFLHKIIKKKPYPLLEVISKNEDEYIYHLYSDGENVTYFDYKGGISEYFLFKETLIKKAKEYNLTPIDDGILNFSNWYIKYIADQKHKKLSTQEQIVSFLNFSFIFVKGNE